MRHAYTERGREPDVGILLQHFFDKMTWFLFHKNLRITVFTYRTYLPYLPNVPIYLTYLTNLPTVPTYLHSQYAENADKT